MVQIYSGAERKQKDYKLTCYACYLIAQNGDTIKEEQQIKYKKTDKRCRKSILIFVITSKILKALILAIALMKIN